MSKNVKGAFLLSVRRIRDGLHIAYLLVNILYHLFLFKSYSESFYRICFGHRNLDTPIQFVNGKADWLRAGGLALRFEHRVEGSTG